MGRIDRCSHSGRRRFLFAVRYANGLSNGGGMSFALSCTMSDRIAAVGHCAPDPVETEIRSTVRRRLYRHGAGDAYVVLYTVVGRGHVSPGGMPLPEWFLGPNSDAIDATELMWEFFSAHPLKGHTRGERWGR